MASASSLRPRAPDGGEREELVGERPNRVELLLRGTDDTRRCALDPSEDLWRLRNPLRAFQ